MKIQSNNFSIWTTYGVEVKISTKDVTTERGCEDLIKEATELGPVDAIFNLAVVLKDALFENQTEENFEASLAPKARATLYLDRVTRKWCPKLRFTFNLELSVYSDDIFQVFRCIFVSILWSWESGSKQLRYGKLCYGKDM